MIIESDLRDFAWGTLPLVFVGADSTILHASRPFEILFGYRYRELAGVDLTSLIGTSDPIKHREYVNRFVRSDSGGAGFLVPMLQRPSVTGRMKDGTLINVSISLTAGRLANGQDVAMAVAARAKEEIDCLL